MKKTIVLGFDGASPDLIKKWSEENELPNFKKIIDEGVFGELESTMPPITPCAWSSFMTGVNPGKHGIYDFFYLDEFHKMKIQNSATRKCKDLWEYLSEKNLKSLVFNVPFTYPPREINGIMITDFTTPSTKARFTHPAELGNYILKKYPDFTFSHRVKYSENKENEFRDDVLSTAEIRFKIAADLLEKEDFDFSMIVFMLLDHTQHWYWKYMDKSHPDYVKAVELEHAIKDAYKKADALLGKFIDRFSGHNILIMSDHGGGPYYKDVTINNWLMNEGYLFLKEKRSFIKKIAESIGADKLISKGLNLGLWKIINGFPVIKNFIRKKLLLTYSDIDWKKTRAYSYGCYGPIYINRDTVESNELETLKNEIENKLKKIKDPVTGDMLIRQIWNREELYSGKEINSLPDLVLNMGDFKYTCSSTFPFSSKEIFSTPKTFKSGDHTLHGIFMAYGPDIKRGKGIKNAKIYDIAPTVLHMFSIPIIKGIDGRVLTEIFDKSSDFLRPVEYQDDKDYSREKTDTETKIDKSDEDIVKERLKGLGYL